MRSRPSEPRREPPRDCVITCSTRQDAIPRTLQALTGRLHAPTIWPLSHGEIAGESENLLEWLRNDHNQSGWRLLSGAHERWPQGGSVCQYCLLLAGKLGRILEACAAARLKGGGRMGDHRKATRSRVGVWSVAAGAAIAWVAWAGLVYQTWATGQDRRRLSPPGRLVDAGGHKLHLVIAGEDRGGPTVVLEAGGMATAAMWALIQPGIAEFARVVSYDRAGLGWSESGPAPRDARTIARELHTALLNAGLPGPYLLVGASLGGPYAAVFADTFPDETAGLVLVDSVHPDQLQRLPPQAKQALGVLRLANRVLPGLAKLGLTHLVDVTGILLAGLPSKLPAEAGAQLRAFAHWPGHWAAVDGEVSAWDDTMDQMRRAMHGAGPRGLPLTVLTAPDNPGMEAMRDSWLDMQRDLASFSSNASHLVIEGAGHISMATEPEPTHIVIQAVEHLIDAWQSRPTADQLLARGS